MTNLPLAWIRNVSALLEKRPYSPFTIFLFALFVGSLRRFLEWVMGGVSEPFPVSFAVTLTSFYWLTFFVFAVILRLLVNQPWRVSINVVLVGIFLGIFPPILDTLIGGTGFRYAYMWGVPSGFNWLLYNPELGIPIGETIVLWAVIAFTGVYVGQKTRSAARAAAALALAYAGLILIGGAFAVAAVAFARLAGWQPAHQIALLNQFQILAAAGLYLALEADLRRALWRAAPFVLAAVAAALFGSEVAGGASAVTLAYLPAVAFVAFAARAEFDPPAERSDLHFLRLSAGMLTAALAAANATVALPLAMVALAPFAAPANRAVLRGAAAAGAFAAGAQAAVEHAAYGAPRWWITMLPETLLVDPAGAFDGLTGAVLAAVTAAAVLAGYLAGKPAPRPTAPFEASQAVAAAFAVAAAGLSLGWIAAGAYPVFALAELLAAGSFLLLAFLTFALVYAAASGRPWRDWAAKAVPFTALGLLPAAAGEGRFWFPPPGFEGTLLYDGHAAAALAWWAAVAATAASVWRETRSVGRAVAAAGLGYAAAVLLWFGPSLAAEYLRLSRGWPEEFRYAALNALQAVAVLGAYALLRPGLVRGGARRVPHALPFLLVCAMGSAFAWGLSATTVPYALTLLLAGWIALAQNDYFDTVEDTLQGRAPYLDLDDVRMLTAVAALGVSALAAAHASATLPALMALAAFMLYNFPFYRAKRYFPSNLKVEGVWGFCAFAFGVVASYEHAAFGAPRWWASHSPLPAEALRGPFPGAVIAALFLAFGGFSLVAVLKDYKDWREDAAAGVQTVYTLAAKRGRPVERLHAYLLAACSAALAAAPVLMALAGKTGWEATAGGAVAAASLWFALSGPPSAARFRVALGVFASYFFFLVLMLVLHAGRAPAGVLG